MFSICTHLIEESCGVWRSREKKWAGWTDFRRVWMFSSFLSMFFLYVIFSFHIYVVKFLTVPTFHMFNRCIERRKGWRRGSAIWTILFVPSAPEDLSSIFSWITVETGRTKCMEVSDLRVKTFIKGEEWALFPIILIEILSSAPSRAKAIVTNSTKPRLSFLLSHYRTWSQSGIRAKEKPSESLQKTLLILTEKKRLATSCAIFVIRE